VAVTVRTLQNFDGGEWIDATGDSVRATEVADPVAR